MKNQIFVLAFGLLLISSVFAEGKTKDDKQDKKDKKNKEKEAVYADGEAAENQNGDFVDNGIYDMYIRIEGFCNLQTRVQFSDTEVLFTEDRTPTDFTGRVPSNNQLEIFQFRGQKAYIPYLNLGDGLFEIGKSKTSINKKIGSYKYKFYFKSSEERFQIDFITKRINKKVENYKKLVDKQIMKIAQLTLDVQISSFKYEQYLLAKSRYRKNVKFTYQDAKAKLIETALQPGLNAKLEENENYPNKRKVVMDICNTLDINGNQKLFQDVINSIPLKDNQKAGSSNAQGKGSGAKTKDQ